MCTLRAARSSTFAGSHACRPVVTGMLLTALLAGCSDGTGPADTGRVIEGVDLDVLFAEPTAAEIETVSSEWESRVPVAADVVVEVDTLVTVGALSVRVRVVSHTVDGLRHYGAVVASDALVDPAPVMVYAHGGDDGAGVDDVLALYDLVGDPTSDFVWVVPSFRSEGLEFADTTWTSDGPPSPWDRDVDDALALLEVALQVEPAADSGRVGALGFSRGGGVALLMGVRDVRIDRVVEFFGPTDFFGAYVQEIVEEALVGSLRDLPGLDHLDSRFVQPLRRGELSVAQVRLELVRRSSVLFAERLPALQLHHGELDTVVDVSQAESLIAVMEELGRGVPEFEAYLYPAGAHSLLTMPESLGRTVSFLEELFGGQALTVFRPRGGRGERRGTLPLRPGR